MQGVPPTSEKWILAAVPRMLERMVRIGHVKEVAIKIVGDTESAARDGYALLPAGAEWNGESDTQLLAQRKAAEESLLLEQLELHETPRVVRWASDGPPRIRAVTPSQRSLPSRDASRASADLRGDLHPGVA